jgi:hypothetical protein
MRLLVEARLSTTNFSRFHYEDESAHQNGVEQMCHDRINMIELLETYAMIEMTNSLY